MSKQTGRRGEPKKANRAARLLARGLCYRSALRLAGYCDGVAKRGVAAFRHSQLLQRAVRDVLARTSVEDISADAFLKMSNAFPGLELFDLKTEYYGYQRDRNLTVIIQMPESMQK